MRLNTHESASAVLERLRANQPVPPRRPEFEPGYGKRLKAWQVAVAREEAREETERAQVKERGRELERGRVAANRREERNLRMEREALDGAEVRQGLGWVTAGKSRKGKRAGRSRG